MARGPLFHLLCMRLAIAGLLGFPILFRDPAIFQWWVANDIDKYDTHVLTAAYFKLVHHCTFKSSHVVKLGVSRVYTGESCLCTWAHFLFKNQWSWQTAKVSSNLELAGPSAKLSHLEWFAIYGISRSAKNY